MRMYASTDRPSIIYTLHMDQTTSLQGRDQSRLWVSQFACEGVELYTIRTLAKSTRARRTSGRTFCVGCVDASERASGMRELERRAGWGGWVPAGS